MRKDRKFEFYRIYITDPRGNSTRVEFSEDEERDYFKMIDNYNKCKEEFTYEKLITLRGVNPDKNEYVDIKIYENKIFDLNAPYKQLLGQLFMIVEEMCKRKNNESKALSAMDVEDQVFRHLIEGYDGLEEKSNEEKVKIYNDYSEFRKRRRKLKTEMYDIGVLNKIIDIFELKGRLKNHMKIIRENEGELDTFRKKDHPEIPSRDYNYILYEPGKPNEKKKIIKKMKHKYNIEDDVINHRLILKPKKRKK